MDKLTTYETAEIRVTYDSEVCTHAARCVRGLPQVFDPNASPWIQLQNAEAATIAEQVKRCPSGALQVSYVRPDERSS